MRNAGREMKNRTMKSSQVNTGGALEGDGETLGEGKRRAGVAGSRASPVPRTNLGFPPKVLPLFRG